VWWVATGHGAVVVGAGRLRSAQAEVGFADGRSSDNGRSRLDPLVSF
jgi:hypothetical protein